MNKEILRYPLLINGNSVVTEKMFEVEDPATRELVGFAGEATEREALMAVDAATRAFGEWSQISAYERAELIERWYTIVEARKEEIARVMTLEQGKPLEEAIGEMSYASSFIKWYAEEAKRVYGETIPALSASKRILVKKQPVGVTAVVTPWNFPASMITRKVAPALAAGCTVLIKPAEQTPLCAYLLAECAIQAGIPAGVINVVSTTNAETVVNVWMKDKRVKKVTFTGSTPVGKLLMKKASDTVKKVSLELGGLAPFIITEDASLEAAVNGVIQSKFRNAGQTCICANRIFVHERVKDQFLEKFHKAVCKLQVGNGFEGSDIGPLIDQKAIEKVKGQIEDALSKGAKILEGTTPKKASKGYFMTPSILSEVTDEMICMQEETFGPIAPVSTFSNDEEVIRRANNTDFGLAAYVYTESLKKAAFYGDQLEYGIVGINDSLPSVAQAPFGGMKESGLGREGGKYGLEEFLELKYISLQM